MHGPPRVLIKRPYVYVQVKHGPHPLLLVLIPFFLMSLSSNLFISHSFLNLFLIFHYWISHSVFPHFSIAYSFYFQYPYFPFSFFPRSFIFIPHSFNTHSYISYSLISHSFISYCFISYSSFHFSHSFYFLILYSIFLDFPFLIHLIHDCSIPHFFLIPFLYFSYVPPRSAFRCRHPTLLAPNLNRAELQGSSQDQCA